MRSAPSARPTRRRRRASHAPPASWNAGSRGRQADLGRGRDMPQVQVTIGGRPYRLACAAGEEAHLSSLAALVDSKVTEMRDAFRELDDQRIVVMAALSLADDLSVARGKAETGEAQAGEALAREAQAR